MRNFKFKQFVKFFVLIVLCTLALFFTACGSKNEGASDKVYYASENEGSAESLNDSTEHDITDNRKIYYTVFYYLQSNDCENDIKKVNTLVKSFEGYVESSDYSNTRSNATATYVVRIPSDKLDAFMAQLETGSSITSKSITSTDVTTAYVNLEAQIQTLDATRAFYQNMLEDGNLTASNLITYKDKIDQIDIQLNKLNIQKTQYDKLIEYSKVTIRFNQDIEQEDEEPGVFDGFLSEYGTYLLTFLKVLIEIIVYIAPFALIAGIVLSIIFVPKKIKKAKAKKAEATTGTDKKE